MSDLHFHNKEKFKVKFNNLKNLHKNQRDPLLKANPSPIRSYRFKVHPANGRTGEDIQEHLKMRKQIRSLKRIQISEVATDLNKRKPQRLQTMLESR